MTTIRNNLVILSSELVKSEPYYFERLFSLKDMLFNTNGLINPFVFGHLFEMMRYINYRVSHMDDDIWSKIYPQIALVSKEQFLDGYYAEAAEKAFKEINSRVKKIYHVIDSTTQIPDGKDVMNKVFSTNNPMLKLCDLDTSSEMNI